jgi:hypothetical protein
MERLADRTQLEKKKNVRNRASCGQNPAGKEEKCPQTSLLRTEPGNKRRKGISIDLPHDSDGGNNQSPFKLLLYFYSYIKNIRLLWC